MNKPKSDPPKNEPTERIPLPEGQASLPEAAWDEARIGRLLQGQIGAAELQLTGKRGQYEIAEAGQRFLSEGKLDDAKKVFEALLSLDPRDAHFNTVLGSIAQQQGDLEQAEQLYTRALQANPFAALASVNRGEVRILRGNPVEAAKDLQRVIEQDPKAREKSTKRAKAMLAQLQAKNSPQGEEP